MSFDELPSSLTPMSDLDELPSSWTQGTHEPNIEHQQNDEFEFGDADRLLGPATEYHNDYREAQFLSVLVEARVTDDLAQDALEGLTHVGVFPDRQEQRRISDRNISQKAKDARDVLDGLPLAQQDRVKSFLRSIKQQHEAAGEPLNKKKDWRSLLISRSEELPIDLREHPGAKRLLQTMYSEYIRHKRRGID